MRSVRNERLLRLAAGRRGLKVIRNRQLTASGQKRYCLRALWDASLVVGHLSSGEFGLIKASEGREKLARWLSLKEVTQVLATWSAPTPIDRSSSRFRRDRPPAPRRDHDVISNAFTTYQFHAAYPAVLADPR